MLDSFAYGFSWLWILVPMLLLGSSRQEYVVCFVLVLVLTDVHRHYGFPYVYLDSAVRSRFPIRFLVLPAILVAAFVATPLWVKAQLWITPQALFAGLAWGVVGIRLLNSDRGDGDRPAANDIAIALLPGLVPPLLAFAFLGAGAPTPVLAWLWLLGALVSAALLELRVPARRLPFASPVLVIALAGVTLMFAPMMVDALPRGRVPFREVFDAIAVAAGIWNFWHVYAQKYGIFRLYNAKGGGPSPVPAWADRCFVFAFFPLYVTWLAPNYADTAIRQFSQAREIIPRFVEFLLAIQPVAVPLSLLFALFAVASYLRFEWKSNRFGNPARNSMALGTTALGLAFFAFDPIKCYLAFAFSHAVEYMVFVWGFQKRRYGGAPLAHDPLIGRILRHPWVFYLGFTGILCGLAVYLGFWGALVSPASERPMFFGIPGWRWLVAWTVYQSLMHFYFDGFLWKMRDPKLREHL